MTEPRTATPVPARPQPSKRPDWLIPVGLIVLSLVPVLAGSLRLAELTTDLDVIPAEERFLVSPIPLVAHIIGATVYLVLGAFQFVPRLRRGRPSWHRIAGRILVPAGLIAALSGMWMGVFYERPPYDMVVRLVFGAAMAVSILLGLRAVLRRDFTTHRAWMIRGYAIGIGAGTQVFTALAWILVTGGAEPDAPTTCALLVAGWVINLAVAETVIRRPINSMRP